MVKWFLDLGSSCSQLKAGIKVNGHADGDSMKDMEREIIVFSIKEASSTQHAVNSI